MIRITAQRPSHRFPHSFPILHLANSPSRNYTAPLRLSTPTLLSPSSPRNTNVRRRNVSDAAEGLDPRMSLVRRCQSVEASAERRAANLNENLFVGTVTNQATKSPIF